MIIISHLIRDDGVFPSAWGDHIPAATSLVVSGENLSAIIVTSALIQEFCKVTAVERPMMPAPTTQTLGRLVIVMSSYKRNEDNKHQ